MPSYSSSKRSSRVVTKMSSNCILFVNKTVDSKSLSQSEGVEKARIFLRHHTQRLRGIVNGPKPKGAIFISAGFDASEHEGAGMQRHSVNVPSEFYARFTRDIVQLAQEEGTGVDGRVISVLEGGYSDKALISGVLSHVSGLCHGQHVAATAVPKLTGDGLADEMARLNMGGLSGIPQAGNLAGIDDIDLGALRERRCSSRVVHMMRQRVLNNSKQRSEALLRIVLHHIAGTLTRPLAAVPSARRTVSNGHATRRGGSARPKSCSSDWR